MDLPHCPTRCEVNFDPKKLKTRERDCSAGRSAKDATTAHPAPSPPSCRRMNELRRARKELQVAYVFSFGLVMSRCVPYSSFKHARNQGKYLEKLLQGEL
ncbi:Hypothetical predicted protein [Cloeon dipterum]|uniref:Uncharacterized protein n=1 Tax=Cloeon dipterum TaxID=197152 RepID=A0A8S1DSI8_9INSE|nr:Hypothetical predicted protein [Cloeon dipterum]